MPQASIGDDTDVRGSCFVADRQACREAAFCSDRSLQCAEWGAKDSATGPAGHHRLCKVLQHGRAACPSTEGMFATAQFSRDAGFADNSTWVVHMPPWQGRLSL